MNDIVKLKVVPAPVPINGRRERFVSGWSTAGVANWLVSRKVKHGFIGLSEVASVAYGRDSAANRQSVKRNIGSLRRYMATHDEFLLVRYGDRHRVEALKVCNFADLMDRQIAEEQLISLEAKGEVTLTEAERWRTMLFLPTSGGPEDVTHNP
jgi:hypothetical protein